MHSVSICLSICSLGRSCEHPWLGHFTGRYLQSRTWLCRGTGKTVNHTHSQESSYNFRIGAKSFLTNKSAPGSPRSYTCSKPTYICSVANTLQSLLHTIQCIGVHACTVELHNNVQSCTKICIQADSLTTINKQLS